MICSIPSPLYQDNKTSLYVASQEGHHDVVQSLVEAGADVDIARSDVSGVVCKYMYLLQSTCFINTCIVYRSYFSTCPMCLDLY